MKQQCYAAHLQINGGGRLSVLTWLSSHNVLCVVTQSIAERQGDSDGPRTVLCVEPGPHRVLQLRASVDEGVHHLRLSTLRQPAGHASHVHYNTVYIYRFNSYIYEPVLMGPQAKQEPRVQPPSAVQSLLACNTTPRKDSQVGYLKEGVASEVESNKELSLKFLTVSCQRFYKNIHN